MNNVCGIENCKWGKRALSIDNLKIIKENVIFKDLDLEKLEGIFSNVSYSIKCFKKGECIFSELNKNKYIGIILKGEMQAKKYHYSGKEIILNKMKKGDVIGISSLGNRQDFFPTEIIAVKDSRVLIIENKEYINILKSDTMLLDNYFTYVSEKIYFLNKRIEGFTSENALERLVCFLESEKIRGYNKDKIKVEFTKEELCKYLSISRASLYRALKKLKDTRKITCYSSTIIINSDEDFREILN
ncbi:hypothetical protein A0J52_03165 [Clostridium sporogenes]|uniref:Crp/Fnr family transcriptional regulator n=1 Tax=Clostridium sporogenes TaxID=1509 RepID=A0A7X5SXB7_CLOSG|nr:Crp/Fnr family transcriptional regulator [Clostridium sporogenes]AJD30741.1 cyclic nucleotide-binding domain protein [Clostridium botulinum Prevot_594]EHN16180.1 CRP/FNR family transcriptional regulator [Clostridium sporogenes PA 3679]AKC62128.1 cAMP-binding protein [Clostridium sporogenes]AKJ89413.1 hypothetical protein CLSPOx_07110 [Clostridium sporogenes]KCZ69436.1 cAMP-binding protein [Clostridium sporogenes]